MTSRLLLGDCLELLPTLDSDSVEAVITDSPYSSGGLMRSDRTNDTRLKYVVDQGQEIKPGFSGDNRDQRAYGYWCSLWLSQCLRVTQPGGVLCMFTDWRQLPTTTDALQAGGWVWRGLVVWDKTEAARPDKGRFRNQCEYVVWGSKGPMPEREDGPCLPGVFRLYGKPDEKVHIAGKPVGLMRQLLRIVPAGGTVLDPFMGGGSTGMACIEEGYGFIGCELDPYWFEVARRRIEGSGHLFTGLNGAQPVLQQPALLDL
jgi:site-specific DNA-methyltransferase (adenine-specific)